MTAFRILVVDDEKDIVASLGGLLRDEGYEMVSAPNGEEGLKKAVGVDLVLLDLMLPGMDGLETLRRIKARDVSLPVVMMSGQGTVAVAVEAVQPQLVPSSVLTAVLVLAALSFVPTVVQKSDSRIISVGCFCPTSSRFFNS